MTWEAHLFFELIHFLLKKPFHQLQFLFNFNHSSLHYSHQLFLGSLKGKKECISFEKSCHTENTISYFPHQMLRERTACVCLCSRKEWISDDMGVLNTARVAHVRKVTLSEKESKI